MRSNGFFKQDNYSFKQLIALKWLIFVIKENEGMLKFKIYSKRFINVLTVVESFRKRIFL